MAVEYKIVSTCPDLSGIAPEERLAHLAGAARWCEEAGHAGLLLRCENRLLDPWVAAQAALAATQELRPIVTVQPLHLHPYAAAKKVASLAHLYGRGPDLLLAAGRLHGDLISLDDRARHDDRYRRLVEFGTILRLLLSARAPVSFAGEHYRLEESGALAPLPSVRQPRLFVAGSSDAGRRAAAELGAHAVACPGLGEIGDADAVRLGIVTRPDAGAAWEAARARFRLEAGRRLDHRLQMLLSDSRWHRDLQELADEDAAGYWLAPFEHGESPVAYLVGDYRSVARELRRLFDAAHRWFFLDVPAGPEDLRHVAEAFRRAWTRHSSPLALRAS